MHHQAKVHIHDHVSLQERKTYAPPWSWHREKTKESLQMGSFHHKEEPLESLESGRISLESLVDGPFRTYPFPIRPLFRTPIASLLSFYILGSEGLIQQWPHLLTPQWANSHVASGLWTHAGWGSTTKLSSFPDRRRPNSQWILSPHGVFINPFMCYICDPDCLVQPSNSRNVSKPIGEGASSLCGGRPCSPEDVSWQDSCSRPTPRLHWCKSGVALEQQTFSGLLGLPQERLLAPSPLSIQGQSRNLSVGPGNQGRKATCESAPVSGWGDGVTAKLYGMCPSSAPTLCTLAQCSHAMVYTITWFALLRGGQVTDCDSNGPILLALETQFRSARLSWALFQGQVAKGQVPHLRVSSCFFLSLSLSLSLSLCHSPPLPNSPALCNHRPEPRTWTPLPGRAPGPASKFWTTLGRTTLLTSAWLVSESKIQRSTFWGGTMVSHQREFAQLRPEVYN